MCFQVHMLPYKVPTHDLLLKGKAFFLGQDLTATLSSRRSEIISHARKGFPRRKLFNSAGRGVCRFVPQVLVGGHVWCCPLARPHLLLCFLLIGLLDLALLSGVCSRWILPFHRSSAGLEVLRGFAYLSVGSYSLATNAILLFIIINY